eukprot:SAG31_NODE_3075_length_4712_cov_2.262302_2_plen_37_part_00
MKPSPAAWPEHRIGGPAAAAGRALARFIAPRGDIRV